MTTPKRNLARCIGALAHLADNEERPDLDGVRIVYEFATSSTTVLATNGRALGCITLLGEAYAELDDIDGVVPAHFARALARSQAVGSRPLRTGVWDDEQLERDETWWAHDVAKLVVEGTGWMSPAKLMGALSPPVQMPTASAHFLGRPIPGRWSPAPLADVVLAMEALGAYSMNIFPTGPLTAMRLDVNPSNTTDFWVGRMVAAFAVMPMGEVRR